MICDEYEDAHPDDCQDNAVPALVMYTSGTSAFPKGVIVSQDNLIHSCTAISRYLGYDSTPSACCSFAVALQLCSTFTGMLHAVCGWFYPTVRGIPKSY